MDILLFPCLAIVNSVAMNMGCMYFFFSFFRAAPVAYGSSMARDQAQTSAVTQATTETMPHPHCAIVGTHFLIR